MGEEERRQILRMVSEGKLSPEEAAGLLEAVDDNVGRSNDRTDALGSIQVGRSARVGRPTRSRALIIHIKEGGDNKVNIRIPLSLARAAQKFIPRQAQNYLQNYEIDLQQFLDDAGEAEGGTILEVKEGDNRVLIAVE